MKILFYSSGALMHQFISVLMDEAIIYSKQGHDVYFAYNDCLLGVCTYNLSANSYECNKCHLKMQKSLQLLPQTIHKINISQYYDKKGPVHFEYTTIKEIKKLEYKQVKIGYSVLSSYISITRNLSPIISNDTRYFWDNLLAASCRLTDALEKVIDEIQPDRVCFFNTRFFDWRPPFDLARTKGIETISCERTNSTKEKNYKIRFVNMAPHNIKGVQSRCDEWWNNDQLSAEEKNRIGKNFFDRRRSGVEANDKVYIGLQEKDKLPSDWDYSKRNFVIFNSSEDEYASIGDEYDSKSLFPTQYQGICHILDTFKKEGDIHVYLRIHPNLADVPYRYHTALEELAAKYDNITIIPAKDSISTYALLDAAEKVIVFGSTMGIEAAYWGKPVILLAGAFYYYSDICYIPKSKDEVKELLLSILEPKNKENAIKWGFYFMYNNPDDRSKYIDIDSGMFRIGKMTFQDIHYMKLLGSSKLYAIYLRYLHKKSKGKLTSRNIPWDEDLSVKL